ncbi:hypothetical protein B0H14DRAFT_3587931 [Mycena olivaceomarginata]|nr:hypothetical protein B0H14DRAFT_3587931 [Mycena olivaceomarginata]
MLHQATSSEAMLPQPAHEVVATMPTYRRTLSLNELSYFLPSRANGANDMFNRVTVHGPASLISPLRASMAWAILRLRHSLMACRVEMQPGCYDDAQFVYTPPSSPSQALSEATACVRILDGVPGPELSRSFLCGPRTLSSDRLSLLTIARHGQVSPGIWEFDIVVMFAHMIIDGIAMQESIQLILELLGGSDTPRGAPRTDAELAKLLAAEWAQRWGAKRHAHDAIVAATEVRIMGLSQSKFQEAAWKVDNQNVQRRFIGGHTFPRTKSTFTNFRVIQTQFDVSQTTAIFAQCKANRTSVANMTFALTNFAWIRLCAAHPEINAPKDLPTLIYTAVNLRRYLKAASPLESPIRGPDEDVLARGREAQRQIMGYAQSPLLTQRAMVNSKVRGVRAKAWARIDDEADGTLPRTPRAPAPAPPAATTPATAAPSLALLGFSHSGNWDQIYRHDAFAPIRLVAAVGAARNKPSGTLAYTWTFLGRLNLSFLWDEAGFPPGLMEEFRRYLIDGVHEYVLNDPSLKGTANEVDCLVAEPLKVAAKL